MVRLAAKRTRPTPVVAILVALMIVSASQASAQNPQTTLDSAALWNSLGSEHEDEAQAALNVLAADPDATLDLIEHELAPLPNDLTPRIRELVAELGDAQFARREQAQDQLANYGALAAPELRRLLAADLPFEAKTRVEQLLALRFGPFAITAPDRRMVRVAQLLERIDDPRAHALFAALKPVRMLAIINGRIAPLYQQLYSTTPADRATAAVELLALGGDAAPALPRLIEMLGDVGPLVTVGQYGRRVADHVAENLPKLGPPTVPPLIAALDDANPDVRKRAVTILGKMNDERAIDPLIARLQKGDKECISELVNALGLFGSKAVPPLLVALETPDAGVRGYILSTLGKTNDLAAIKPIASRLHDADPTVRKWALESLREFKEAAIDELVAAFHSTDRRLREDAALRQGIFMMVGSFEDPRVAAIAIKALVDDQPEVRAHAFYAITFQNREALSDPAVAQTVLAAFHDSSPRVRAAAMQLTGNALRFELSTAFDPRQVNAALLAALNDEDLDVRITAAHALGSRRCTAAVDPLIGLLDEEPTGSLFPINIKLAAAEALGEIGDPRATKPLLEMLETQTETRIVRSLGQLHDPESVPALINLLKADDQEIRYTAAQALGEIKDPSAVKPLIALMLADEQPRRFGNSAVDAAVRALGDIADPRAIQPVIELTRKPPKMMLGFDDSESNTHNATFALQRMGRPAIPFLATALSDECQTTREVAASALSELDIYGDDIDALDMQPAVEPLVAALSDSSQSVRFAAATCLGRLGDKRAAPGLLEIIRSYIPYMDDGPGGATGPVDPYLIMNAASDLGRLKDPETAAPLIALLDDNRPAVRTAAIRALACLSDERIAERLLPLLDDGAPEVRVEAASALGRLKVKTAVPRLTMMLDVGTPALRAAAAESLGRIGGEPVADALAPLVEDDAFEVRFAAAMALVRLDDPRGIPAVTRILASGDEKQREQAITDAATMQFVPTEALLPIFSAALDEPQDQARRFAAYGLGRIGSDAAVDALLANLDDPKNLAANLEALGASKHPRAFPILVAYLDDAMPWKRAVAAIQLGLSEDISFAPKLIEHLDDNAPEVRIAVIDALTRLKATSAIPAITTAANDPDPRVAQHAARALERLKPQDK